MRRDIEPIIDDPTVQTMLRRRSLAKETEITYLKGIARFSRYMGMSPQEIIERFRQDPSFATESLCDFIADMKSQLAVKTMKNVLQGIRIWLKENKAHKGIDWEEVVSTFRSYFGKVRTLVNRDYISREEIIKLLHVAKLRERAIICCAASSGLRIGDTLLKLQLKHIKDDIWDEGLPFYMIEVPGQYTKEGIPHITFISAEAASYLRAYLKERENEGERITPESPLFVSQYRKPLQPQSFRNVWAELCRKAGIDRRGVPIKGCKKLPNGQVVRHAIIYNIRPHSLRKYFKTACSMAGVDRMASEAFLGHSLAAFGIESVYDYCVANLDFLKTQYSLVLPLVTFLTEAPSARYVVNGEARRRIEQLESLLAEKELELQKLRQRLAELEGLADRVSRIEALLSRLDLNDLINEARRRR